eukprot:134887-Chlamydomonas_euryale.AAC.1
MKGSGGGAGGQGVWKARVVWTALTVSRRSRRNGWDEGVGWWGRRAGGVEGKGCTDRAGCDQEERAERVG